MQKNYIDEIKTAENFITDVLPKLDMLIRQIEKSYGDYDSLSFIKTLAMDIKDTLNKALE